MSLVNIGTFNVNSVKSRMPILERYLKSVEAPDILCLQETKCQDADFPVDFFKKLGYKCAYKGMKSYNGVAIVSKKAPDSVSFGLGDGEAEPARAESELARVAVARFGDLNIVNTYIPQGKEIDNPDFPYKLRFFERVRALFEREFKPSDKVLWLGDLNVAPTDIDVTNPKTKKDHVCFTQAVKDTYENVLTWGFTDIFRKFRPNEGEFSFWDYRVKNSLERNIGWRIDHILGTAPLVEVSQDAWVVRELRAMERPSDHTAVVGSFKMQL
ncbi:exodeoxyribonuclease III [Synergistaceae bacterium OttesenSCG-928-D05]|nr:exodeoxyribonuclease III [Synergistaceae bacterium OttesenSCG-928-D05]